MKPLFLVFALVCCIGPAAVSADGLPDMGSSAEATLSPELERRIGADAMADIRSHDPDYVDDSEVNDYLSRLVNRLASGLDVEARQSFSAFGVLDDSINAFAMPGGYIGVNSGLIVTTENESELAGVLGHEISHVSQHHLARSVSQSQDNQLASMLVMALAIMASGGRSDLAGGAIIGSQAYAVQQQLGYSRSFEQEADRLGVNLLEKAGFDTRGMATFFKRMERYTHVMESTVPGYLRTHPLSLDRMADISNRVAQSPQHEAASSLDYQLVRAKLHAQQGDWGVALAYFSDEVLAHPDDAVAHYGYARALLRAQKLDLAEQQLLVIRRMKLASFMVETLSADIQLAQGKNQAAIASLQAATVKFPEIRAVKIALAEALLRAKQYRTVLDVTQTMLASDSDGKAYILQARAYGELMKPFFHHRALAEALLIQKQEQAAAEQFLLATQAKDGDFFEHAQVDAKLWDLRQKLTTSEKDKFR